MLILVYRSSSVFNVYLKMEEELLNKMFMFRFSVCGLGGGGGGSGGDAVDGGSDAGDFSIEYAKSGKSKCKACEDFIGKVKHGTIIQ